MSLRDFVLLVMLIDTERLSLLWVTPFPGEGPGLFRSGVVDMHTFILPVVQRCEVSSGFYYLDFFAKVDCNLRL